MDDDFQEHLAGLMDYRTEPAAPVSVTAVRAGARRRTRLRTAGVAGSALAVAAVGVGVAAFAGPGGHGAASGGASPAGVGGAVTPPPASRPVSSPATDASSPAAAVRVAAGTTIKVNDDLSVTVTDTDVCYAVPGRFVGSPGRQTAQGCVGATKPSLRWHQGRPPSIDDVGIAKVGIVAAYQGPDIPARAEAVMLGKRYPATLVSTPGMRNWTAVYVALPPVPAGMLGSPGLVVYDATGKVLAQHADMETPIPTKSSNGE